MADQAAPDWNSDAFNQLKQQVIERFQCSEEDAVARLQAMWGNATQSLLERVRTPSPNRSPSPSRPPPSPPLKRKVTFPDFDLHAPIADRIPCPPSQFAAGKIESLDYVELWYFTIEGCNEASKATPTTMDDTFGLLNTETGLTLQPIKNSKASKNAINDEHLTWEQIMTARHNLIATAIQAGWPKKHTLALAELYINLESLKAAGHNPRALILYHATVRRQWHATMKGRGQPFNISLINEKLLSDLGNQIRDRDQEEIRRQASNSNQTNKNLN